MLHFLSAFGNEARYEGSMVINDRDRIEVPGQRLWESLHFLTQPEVVSKR